MNQVNLELFRPETNLLDLNDAEVRGLAETPSGTITIANLRGKSYLFAFSIATNQVDANLRSLAIAAGWNGTSPVQATINSGVWISGSVAGNSTAALTIDGSFPNGVTLINNGTIAGRGGTGASTTTSGVTPSPGQAGGLALSASVPVTIQNNGTIAGGGGGGGAGISVFGFGNCDMGQSSCTYSRSGGGGGGGRSNVSYTAPGGTGGFGGGTGTSTGPGGGGTGGTSTGVCPSCNGQAPSGGAGGAWGTAGTSSSGSGGAAGIAVTGNANITWSAFGTRLGPIT